MPRFRKGWQNPGDNPWKVKSSRRGRSKKHGRERHSFMEALAMTMECFLNDSDSDDWNGINSELLALNTPAATAQAGANDVFMGTVRGHVVGLQYYSGNVNNNEMVALVREPQNRYDKNAVKVENIWGHQVGHIKRELAESLACIVDNNYARIEGVVPNGKNNRFRMPVDIFFWGPSGNKAIVSQHLRSRGFFLAEGVAGFTGSDFSGTPGRSAGRKESGRKERVYNPRSALGKSIILSEAEMRNEVDSLFDNLESLDKTTEKEPSKCIISPMYRHQKQALNWMLAREVDEKLPPFWEETSTGLYRNSLTNFASDRHPGSIRGGILADEMGLGKTLSVIALILHEFSVPVFIEREDAAPSPTCLLEEDEEIGNELGEIEENKVMMIKEDGAKDCVQLAEQQEVAEEVIAIPGDDSQDKASIPGCSSSRTSENGAGGTASARPKRVCSSQIQYTFTDDSDDDVVYIPSPEKKVKTVKPKRTPKPPKVKGQSAKGKGGKSTLCNETTVFSRKEPVAQASVTGTGDFQKGEEMGPRATLIVCPLSVLSNWIDQFAEHVSEETQVNVCLYYGVDRKKMKAEHLAQHDVVLTTYSTMAAEFKDKKDKSTLHKVEWLRVVLDEAHTIRNPGTLQTQAAHSLKADRRWALTGTPLQNSIKDLWSLVAFLGLEPFKSTQNWWQRIIARPIAQNDSRGIERIRKLMDTLALRRMKSQKMNGRPLVDLPARSVVLQYVDFSKDEEEVYRTMEKDGRLAVGKYFQQGTVLDHYGDILAILMRLRQLCCHPGLCARAAAKLCSSDGSSEKTDEERAELVATLVSFLSQGADEECCICLESIQQPVITRCAHVYCQKCIGEVIVNERETARCPLCRRPVSRESLVHVPKERSQEEDGDAEEWHSSAKVDVLIECLLKERERDETTKCIVVSQFTSFLDLLKKPLTEKGFAFARLDGSMSAADRARAIREFSSEDPASPRIFLLSLKAGGVGINLTAASRVYLLDPAWNPACEEQCFDRCHRLGQTKDVIVTKFIVRDTVEAAMLELQEKKRRLMKRVFDGKQQTAEQRRANRIGDIKLLMGLGKPGGGAALR